MFSFFKKNTDPKERLLKVLKGFSLPSFPTVIMETLQRIRDPNSTSTSISETLSIDPGLSVQVLRLANSVAFSPIKKIENLNQAISLVGLSQLETMVLSVGVVQSTPDKVSKHFNPKRFWLAAARRGVLAQGLAKTLCPSTISECFTAGFLQDMALALLVAQNRKKYSPILEQWYQEGGNLAELERDVCGWDHAEVGTWMCSEWDFPEKIAASIGAHHGTKYKGVAVPAPMVLVSNIGETEESLGVDLFIEQACLKYGMSKETLEELIESCFKKADDLARLMS